MRERGGGSVAGRGDNNGEKGMWFLQQKISFFSRLLFSRFHHHAFSLWSLHFAKSSLLIAFILKKTKNKIERVNKEISWMLVHGRVQFVSLIKL